MVICLDFYTPSLCCCFLKGFEMTVSGRNEKNGANGVKEGGEHAGTPVIVGEDPLQ